MPERQSAQEDRVTPTDETVHVRAIRLPRTVVGYWLTPEGDAALDTALKAEPTVPIPRAVADEARQLARQRRSTEIPEPRQPLL
jgi:hypothetical protein